MKKATYPNADQSKTDMQPTDHHREVMHSIARPPTKNKKEHRK